MSRQISDYHVHCLHKRFLSHLHITIRMHATSSFQSWIHLSNISVPFPNVKKQKTITISREAYSMHGQEPSEYPIG